VTGGHWVTSAQGYGRRRTDASHSLDVLLVRQRGIERRVSVAGVEEDDGVDAVGMAGGEVATEIAA
jgi:hypothetical protein